MSGEPSTKLNEAMRNRKGEGSSDLACRYGLPIDAALQPVAFHAGFMQAHDDLGRKHVGLTIQCGLERGDRR
jgi:hypothetical protein